MAPAEPARLGAHARLAPCVCGARPRAGAAAGTGDRRAPARAPPPPPAHQDTDTSQAGAVIAADAAARAASRRGAQDPAARRGPCARAAGSRGHARNHRHCS